MTMASDVDVIIAKYHALQERLKEKNLPYTYKYLADGDGS